MKGIKGKGWMKHLVFSGAGVLLLFIVPLSCTGVLGAWLRGESIDAVSGATIILDQPSGEYLILINQDMHPDGGKLEDWITFFSGEEITYIFEDITCTVASADPGALALAKSFQSRLPENQMQVRREDVTLMCSQADQGLFDILIFSREMAESCHVETAFGENVVRLYVTGEGAEETTKGESP